jgi:hypothetical protein
MPQNDSQHFSIRLGGHAGTLELWRRAALPVRAFAALRGRSNGPYRAANLGSDASSPRPSAWAGRTGLSGPKRIVPGAAFLSASLKGSFCQPRPKAWGTGFHTPSCGPVRAVHPMNPCNSWHTLSACHRWNASKATPVNCSCPRAAAHGTDGHARSACSRLISSRALPVTSACPNRAAPVRASRTAGLPEHGHQTAFSRFVMP